MMPDDAAPSRFTKIVNKVRTHKVNPPPPPPRHYMAQTNIRRILLSEEEVEKKHDLFIYICIHMCIIIYIIYA